MADKRATVRKLDDIDEFDRGGGVVTRLLCNEGICGAGVTTGTTTLPVGRSVAPHHHNCDEQIVILKGRAEAEFGGQRRPIGPMEVAYIPAGEVHCFYNVGEEPVLMLFIYDAGEVTRTFAATGETVVHLGAGDRAQPKG
ncbi:cupin domain-containing protein [Chelativorans sp. M5D2P16]|uniref:cupin domain-containing protein n=1 Tax=Chelativorans sp. M5D2P16 TaxID=3095678 RepID=UPI002ACA4166|nr:cupin domain-containing protein [Chelativorans sp. M5D2P16]MDZ5696635.1 cupin domain-containing protein [Chelativorans sp. M5D2P16]